MARYYVIQHRQACEFAIVEAESAEAARDALLESYIDLPHDGKCKWGYVETKKVPDSDDTPTDFIVAKDGSIL